ncbi:MAG TPA: BREX protein BrxB domain-containing protein [Azospirillum sp.]|nr:BREX protein BrxB domain-containing protein [Azospirillum sp.]
MARIEDLAKVYERHIKLPWQRTVAGAQRIIMLVYEKEAERALRARLKNFEIATAEAGKAWRTVDITDSFAAWMAGEEYRDAYFEMPEDLQLKLDAEFAGFVADRIRSALTDPAVDEDTVVAVIGAGSLFGFTRLSRVLTLVEPDIRGRLLVFFPGQYEDNTYRLLDARDGWNYLAVPITLHGGGAQS